MIGFAAMLAGLADGTHMGFSGNFPSGNFKSKGVINDGTPATDWIQPWLVPSIIIAVVAGMLAMLLLLMWIGSRGRFMFIDCIVRNRGAIVEPWKEWKRQANSLLLFHLALSAINLSVFAVAALPLLLPVLLGRGFGEWSTWKIVYIVAVGLLFMCVMIVLVVINWLMAPVMYRQRCRALTAFRMVLSLFLQQPVPIVLYALFMLVLFIAGALGSCLITCVTCCLAALPYVGTVVLLPLYVFYYAFALLFLRQFGPDFDAWAGIASAEVPPQNDERPAEQQPPPLLA